MTRYLGSSFWANLTSEVRDTLHAPPTLLRGFNNNFRFKGCKTC